MEVIKFNLEDGFKVCDFYQKEWAYSKKNGNANKFKSSLEHLQIICNCV